MIELITASLVARADVLISDYDSTLVDDKTERGTEGGEEET